MKKTVTSITIASVVVVLAAGNYLASRHPSRLDLTQNRIYTLSNTTKEILKGLDDVVTIRLYFTSELPPALQALARDVDDLLAEFKSAAGQRISIEHIDPATSAMEEQKVAMLGIPPLQVNVVERDKAEVAKVYLGIAVMFSDRQQVIPVVQRIGNLEYDLVEAIVKVSSKESPKIAWMGLKGTPSDGQGFEIVRDVISRRYDITEITEKTFSEIEPERFAALVIASPRGLSDDEALAIDQYLMDGGRVLALVDRFAIGQGLTVEPVESRITDMLAHYGATIEDSIVADQSNAMAAFSGGVVTYHIPYPFWPEVRRGQFNEEEPVVADLESVVLPWTSPLVLATKEASNEVLATTSPNATAVPGKDARLDPQSAGDALISGHREKRVLVALLDGPFTSFFATGRGIPQKNVDFVGESGPGARIFVAGSSHWLNDLAIRTFPQNATLFENALDALALGNMLIGIRSREVTSRPIAALSDSVRAALKYSNLVAGPLAVLVIGLVVFVIKRARRRAVQAVYRT